MSEKTIIIGSNGILGKFIVEKAIEKIGIDNIVLSDYKKYRLREQSKDIELRHGKQPQTRVIDIESDTSIENGLSDIGSVVIALQQREPLIQKICIKNDINSIDLSVDSDFLERAANLKTNSDSIQLLTGGLFPGLSGIIAKDLCSIETNEIIHVGLLQSKNGSNGKTGVSDMLKIFNRNVEYMEENKISNFSGFSKKNKFLCNSDKDERDLRLSDFVERKILEKSGIKSNYYTAFKNERINKAISLLRKIGLLNLLKYENMNNLISSLFTNGKSSNMDETIGLSFKTSKKNICIILKSDYEATASCAIAFLISIKKNTNRGVQYPFQLFSYNEIENLIRDVVKEYKEYA